MSRYINIGFCRKPMTCRLAIIIMRERLTFVFSWHNCNYCNYLDLSYAVLRLYFYFSHSCLIGHSIIKCKRKHYICKIFVTLFLFFFINSVVFAEKKYIITIIEVYQRLCKTKEKFFFNEPASDYWENFIFIFCFLKSRNLVSYISSISTCSTFM